MDKKRILCYMFVSKSPDMRVIKAGDDKLSDYMAANNWKCIGSLELTEEQFEALRFYFEECPI